MRLLRARGGSAELGNVASGSATQSLWLGHRKVGPQLIDEDQSRLPGRGTVGEVRRGRASDRAKERIRRFWVRFGREREEQVACHVLALAMTDEARREAEM